MLTDGDDVVEIRRAERLDDYVATVRWQLRRGLLPPREVLRPGHARHPVTRGVTEVGSAGFRNAIEAAFDKRAELTDPEVAA